MKASNISVRRLMEDVLSGRIVVPDFQRAFIWKPDDVQDLLISVLGKFYIGSMLYMDEPRDSSPFALKFVEGVANVKADAQIDSIIKILLDGQQRTSSLFYALHAPGYPLAGRKSPFLFFMSIPHALAEDWENSVEFALSSNKKAVTRLASNEDFVPFTEFHDIGALLQKLQLTRHANNAARVITLVNDFMSYEVQTVELPRGTDLSRVVETFERINRTGEPLSVADLLVARLYNKKIKLRSLIEEAQEQFPVLSQIDIDYVLRAICLVRDVEVRRKEILELDAEKFVDDWNSCCEGIQSAFRRVTDTKDGYGAFDFQRLVPFKTLLVPLGALHVFMARNGVGSAASFAKVDQWYWATVFANRYNEAVNTKAYSDFKALRDWIIGKGEPPDYVTRFSVASVDLSVNSKNSAIYRGVLCLVTKAGALDYQTGQPPQFVQEKIQDDHIFPSSKYFEDSILNRTLISTNQEKSSKDPGKYFAALETLLGRTKLASILRTHLIDEEGLAALLNNESQRFMASREGMIRRTIAAILPAPSQTDAEAA